MVTGHLYINLLASAADGKPAGSLEARVINFLECNNSTESLDDAAFDQINGSETKADYPLGGRRMIDVGGLLILMNEAEPMIDISAIGYTLKTAFETIGGAHLRQATIGSRAPALVASLQPHAVTSRSD